MKPYRRPFPSAWWLRQRSYFLFMMRELTAFFVAGYTVLLLVLLYKLSQGREAYEGMLVLLKSPTIISVHVVALLFAIYHSITWFNVTPKILVIHIGEERVPGFMIVGGHYAMWLGASAALAWVILKL